MRVERFLLACVWISGSLLGCGKPDSGPIGQPAAASSAPAVASASAPVVPTPVAGSSAASVASQPASATKPPLPAEVVAFRERRDACDHFRGEDPYDAKRAAFLAAEMARTCTGTDRELADLRKRFAGDSNVMAVLKNYEDRIE